MQKLRNNQLLFGTFCKDGSYFHHAKQNSFHTRLTTSLCSLLVKSKDGRMDLNLLRISLCLVMSVARMHLQEEQSEALFWTISKMRQYARSVELVK